MAVVLSELKTELTTDPRSYGYAPYVASGSMSSLASMLNTVRFELPVVYRNLVYRAHIHSRLLASEYYALTPAKRALYKSYTLTDINMKANPEMRTKIEELFPPASQSVSDLQLTVWSQNSTRAEELWGVGVLVTWQECSAALAL
jgi:hypothetical protein